MILKSETHCVTSTYFFVGLLVALVLGGCANNSATRIDARDNTVALGELRMAYNFDHVKEAATPHTGHAIELGVTTGSGSATQSLESGSLPILLDKTKFTGPQQLRNDFNFTYSDISWRYRNLPDVSKFGIELSAGFGESSIDLKVSSATQIASERFKTEGIRAGAALYYRLSHGSSFQARGVVFRSLDISMGRAELVYAKTFLNNFRLRAGFAGGQMLGYNIGKSDYKLEFLGLVLALDVEF